jgi:hypothetical protein
MMISIATLIITSEAKCFVFSEREIQIGNDRLTPKIEQTALKYFILAFSFLPN